MKLRHNDFDIPRDTPVSELMKLRSRLDDQINAQRSQELSVAAQSVRDLAESMGFQITELLPLLTERVEHPVRYRHPRNAELTWCGKGRRPLWMNRALEEGLTLAELTV